MSISYRQRACVAIGLLAFLTVGFVLHWQWAWLVVVAVVMFMVLFLKFR